MLEIFEYLASILNKDGSLTSELEEKVKQGSKIPGVSRAVTKKQECN